MHRHAEQAPTAGWVVHPRSNKASDCAPLRVPTINEPRISHMHHKKSRQSLSNGRSTFCTQKCVVESGSPVTDRTSNRPELYSDRTSRITFRELPNGCGTRTALGSRRRACTDSSTQFAFSLCLCAAAAAASVSLSSRQASKRNKPINVKSRTTIILPTLSRKTCSHHPPKKRELDSVVHGESCSTASNAEAK
jgi:hypothetical protein